ncbi:tripartite tricarboxylate transporter substrate binding protein [Ramlibacter tataouinensis]|uniref:tripartite tricarboxylate transporter substrate binding protein n=1 Tax=Ramlibacter tataouinensis TaxID=94132 RepID=UPI0022F38AF3|nr:tripartite tricarboxylate transporter substrate binding protein [Ramlibacter tataouinensis]WBY02945.1 tripartite tricarboxylate transporter substrate binding protein [Ramlibacter tataouinensis]
MHRFILAAAVAAAAVCAPSFAQVQNFPSKSVTLVVPFTAGGGADALVRAAGRRLSEIWKQPVVIENLPGADTIIGTKRVTKAVPDGHTLLVNTPALLFVKHNHKEEGDLVAELAPVSLLAAGPSVLAASGKSGIKSIADLKATCGKQDAKCSWGSGDLLTSMIGQSLMAKLGLQDRVVEARYKGGNAAVADLVGGHLTLLVTGTANVSQQHAAGSARILALAGDQRVDSLSDVPTYAEAGLGKVDSSQIWVGVFAPKGTPESVRRTIAEALKESLKDTGVVNAMNTMQMRGNGAGPSEFGEVLKTDEANVTRLMSATPSRN